MKLNYCIAGTNDLVAATEFYDALFQGTGVRKILEIDRMTYWQGEGFMFAAALPFDGAPATRGNGSMFGFEAASLDAVKQMYDLVLKLGGHCDGAPAQRGPMFSAYVRDLDQNKLAFYAPQG